MIEMTRLEFNSICRLCVQTFEKEKISPIFKNKTYENTISIPERIRHCSSVEVAEDDGLPPQICNTCLLKLNESFAFRNQCVLASIILKRLKDFSFNVNEIPNLFKVDIENQIIKSVNDDCFDKLYSSPEKLKNKIKNEEKIDEFDNSKNGRHKRNIHKLKSVPLQKRKTLNKKPKEPKENIDIAEGIETNVFSSSVILAIQEKRGKIMKKESRKKIISNKDNETKTKNSKKLFKVKQFLKTHENFKNDLRRQNETDLFNSGKMKDYENFENTSSDLNIQDLTIDCNKKVTESKSVMAKRRKRKKLSYSKEKPSSFKCDYCEKVYPSEGGWRYHIHTMHNENYQPFICDLCGQAFKVKRNLEAHKNSIHFHLKHHLCDLCGRGFASKYSLKVHKSWHNDEKNFTCDVCGTKFRTRGKMNTHRSIHGGPKKFMCHICSRDFRWKKDFEIHMRTHTGEKPFKCSHCGKAFASLTNMKKHEKNHLKDVELDKMYENLT